MKRRYFGRFTCYLAYFVCNRVYPPSALDTQNNRVGYFLSDLGLEYAILTNNLPTGEKRSKFCKQLLYHLITEKKLGELVAAAATVTVRVPLQRINTILEFYG